MLALDTVHTPGHVSSVAVFEAGSDDFDHQRLVTLVEERIPFVPRYRQRVLPVPARLAAPVWVDDDDFDLSFHLRRSALPRPGTMEQLREFVGRVSARRLDRSRPLWELYLVEGLLGNRFALVSKSHLSLVDGIDTVELGQVLLGDTRDVTPAAPSAWHPRPEPSTLELVTSALWQSAQDPLVAVDNVRGMLTSALGVAIAVGDAVGGVGGALGELAEDALRGGRPPSRSPLAGPLSEQRRVALVSAPLGDLKVLQKEHDHTVNDVVLAVVTGALRSWLLTRGEAIGPSSSLTALVPMSVTDEAAEPTSLGSTVAPHTQRLPIGEPNPLMRLHQVAYGTRAHKETGRSVAARFLADIAGFAPPTLHVLGARAAAGVVRRPHDLVITNVPGPQHPLYAAGARMVASYPVLPLTTGHQLAVGVTSYDGDVFFGLTGDRDGLNDLDVLAQCLSDELEELLDATRRAAATRQPTRKASSGTRRTTEAKAAAARGTARGPARKPARKAPVKKAAVHEAPGGTATEKSGVGQQGIEEKGVQEKSVEDRSVEEHGRSGTAERMSPASGTAPRTVPGTTAPSKRAPSKRSPIKAGASKSAAAKKAAMRKVAVDNAPDPVQGGS
jgi:diacylglycerol O-acyltransferase